MEMVGDMEVYSLDEVIDEMIGPEGTPERQEFEEQVKRDEQAFYANEARKQRQRKTLMTKPKPHMVTCSRHQVSFS